MRGGGNRIRRASTGSKKGMEGAGSREQGGTRREGRGARDGYNIHWFREAFLINHDVTHEM